MNHRHFNTVDTAKLRAKIGRAKPILPLPNLMRRLGYDEKHIGKEALCPFHDDHNPSFSVFNSAQGKGWQWKCHAGCGYGDEIAFLVKHFDVPRCGAIKRYLEMAGIPWRSQAGSHEYPVAPACPVPPVSPEAPECPESPVFPESPVSEGQGARGKEIGGEADAELTAFASVNTCDGSLAPEKHLWKLARCMKAVGKRIGRKLTAGELMMAFDEWHRESHQFLDPQKTRDAYWMGFLAQLQKVRFAMGEGAKAEALAYVWSLTEPELPTIPGYGSGLPARKLLALHRELSRRSTKKDKVYFLSYRDAAKVCDGLSHQEAHTITFALASLGVIEIVNNGKAGANSREAAEFRCLLEETQKSAEIAEGDFEL